MLRNAEFKQPDWRLCQEGQETSFPISHIKPFAGVTEPNRLISHLHASYCRRPEIGFVLLARFRLDLS
jgi:hypothetical protein